MLCNGAAEISLPMQALAVSLGNTARLGSKMPAQRPSWPPSRNDAKLQRQTSCARSALFNVTAHLSPMPDLQGCWEQAHSLVMTEQICAQPGFARPENPHHLQECPGVCHRSALAQTAYCQVAEP